MPPSDAAFARALVRDLDATGSEERRAHIAWYYPTKMKTAGAARRASAAGYRAVLDRTKGRTPQEILDLATALCRTRHREATHIAYGLLDQRPAAAVLVAARHVPALAHTLDNWATMDSFCVGVAGRAWLAGKLSDSWFAKWARSNDPWRRRAALVSTVTLNQKGRGGTGDAARTLALCEALVADRHVMVVKAMSWALRALSGPDRAAVESFLARHGDALAPLVRREVGNKLRTGRKNPRKAR